MRTPCEHDRLFLGKTIICGFPRVRVRARTAAKSRATAFKASSTGIFPSVVLGMMLRWHCETTQECERPIILANSRIPAVFSDIRSSSKHKQSRAISPFFSGQTTFSKPITRRPSGLARPAVSEAPSQYLGPLRLPASFTLNAFAQICAKVRKWGFPYVSRVRVRAREAMRPFLNNGTTFTTCKPIAPQRPRPSEQSPKPPRIARAKLELGARSRSIGGRLLTRPSLARARTGGESQAPHRSDHNRMA